MIHDDKRLIEDYLPIAAISTEATREKSVRKGHISTLHLWWARRPLVACRAAVYGGLVPATQFVPVSAADDKKKSLGRANAAKFLKNLCQFPAAPQTIQEAVNHILDAHAAKLSKERNETITVDDIIKGRAPRPKVLDMFAGGGAIPLEALRLGCESYANDLNPVAHIIQLCTLVYPQQYGKSDPNTRGSTGLKNERGEATWGGIANEVRYWGEWMLAKVRREVGDLYPTIPDPDREAARKTETQKERGEFADSQNMMDFAVESQQRLQPRIGELMPVAYFWTRTVECKNPKCGCTVPLVKQTWLCKKAGRYVALRIIAPRDQKHPRFEVVESQSEDGIGFDPANFSSAGNATCPFCGAVVDSAYVKEQGFAKRLGEQLMAVACVNPKKAGRRYLSADVLPEPLRNPRDLRKRLDALISKTGISVPTEPIVNDGKGALFIVLYGVSQWHEIFNDRQLAVLVAMASAVNQASIEMRSMGFKEDHIRAVASEIALLLSKVANRSSKQSMWQNTAEKIGQSFGRQTLAMVWDFVESNPFGKSSGSAAEGLDAIVDVVRHCETINQSATVIRGSASRLPLENETFDAVITDPPYYDNVPYADISDFFYVWLKRSIGSFYPEHFAGEGTPKKQEAVADSTRHGGDKEKAKRAYEEMMANAFREAARILKPTGQMTVVYAHKTTLGWATLVDAIRKAGFMVTEAWPLDTELKGRLRGMESAALASSIFLVARKRLGSHTGSYENEVRTELETIVRERVETLWQMGISGADLVIASVGAGLRAFTQFSQVEYVNGEEVPAERFLTEVETVVLESILVRLSKEVGGKGTSLAGLDAATRFYILWRYTYGAAELDAGEAIIFANGTHVELDGQTGLVAGNAALVEKKKGKYRLRDFAERGETENLGLPSETGQPGALIDTLHRSLWLLEKRPMELPQFLRESQVNREQMRLVAQALAGPALKGGEMGDISPTAELSALGKITANWQSVVEDAALTAGQKEETKKGQKQLI